MVNLSAVLYSRRFREFMNNPPNNVPRFFLVARDHGMTESGIFSIIPILRQIMSIRKIKAGIIGATEALDG